MTVPVCPSDFTTTSTLSTASASSSQKRRRRRSSSPLEPSATEPKPSVESKTPGPSAAASATGASTFRNVSACNRCRLRKNRCDQRLPACLSCEKAGVKCVGYDPITKREIPRSYVHYLERRNEYLEFLLTSNQITFHPPDYFDLPTPRAVNTTAVAATRSNFIKSPSTPSTTVDDRSPSVAKRQRTSEERAEPDGSSSDNQGRLNQLVSDIGLISVQGASDPRYLGSVSGISFARVVFAAVKSTTSVGTAGYVNGNVAGGKNNGKEEDDVDDAGRRNEKFGKDEMRDSFFGLATNKKRVRPAKWPSRQLANRLVDLYFGHANPQLPTLHKVEFEAMVEEVYSAMKAEKFDRERGEPETTPRRRVGARELYMMNIVFAIGAGIYLEKETGNTSSSGSSDDELRRRRKKRARTSKARFSDGEAESSKDSASNPEGSSDFPQASKKVRRDSDSEDNIKQESLYGSGKDDTTDHRVDGERGERQYAPEAYHAAALPHLEVFLSSESKGGLQELQAVLLLAGYALLRPVAPGLWYIVGVAVRLAVDLGLHFEDSNASTTEGVSGPYVDKKNMERLRGHREWVRDLRRKLWWCTYSLDRLVSTCVGRPFGIQDEVVSTRFPSLLPDENITLNGFLMPEHRVSNSSIAPVLPTYKLITHHYFRLRLLQSEILQVLQQQQSMYTSPPQEPYPAHHPFHLRTPYLRNFANLQEWHSDVTGRVEEWMKTAPKSKADTGVDFAFEFFELNYWQTILMLYRPCLKVPALLSGELGGGRGMIDPGGKGVGIGQLRSSNITGRADMGGLTSGTQFEEDRVYCIVAEAGSEVLKLYRRLHRVHQVNYTFLATHHLFMSGIAFLYAIWHSPVVRAKLSMDDIDFTILAATSVLGDLVEKCPPAQACKEAFERMSKATVSMCLAGNSGSAGISRSLGDIGIGSEPGLDCEMRRCNGGRDGYLPGGSGTQMSHRNRVLKDLSGGFQLNNNQMLLQQQHGQVHRQQRMQQQSYAQHDQRWQRQMQNQQHQHLQQQQQQLQQQSRRMNPPRATSMFDIGFESLLQFGQGVQMSESSYRSTQQPSESRRTQNPMSHTPPVEGNKSTESGRQLGSITTEARQQSSSSSLLSSPLHLPLALGQQSQQIHLQQKPQKQQREQNDVTANPMSSTHVYLTSHIDNETTIDPELQREEMDSLLIKPYPGSEKVMHHSPSLMSDTTGRYSNHNSGISDISDLGDWDVGWGELEGGGMGMGMGMGMGQVDLFDGFFFGSGGAGGN